MASATTKRLVEDKKKIRIFQCQTNLVNNRAKNELFVPNIVAVSEERMSEDWKITMKLRY